MAATYVPPVPTTTITTIGYTYDSLYRIIGADYDYDGIDDYAYTYDAVGNRLTQTTAAGTTTYIYDAANRLTSDGLNTYTYDANGNLINDGTSTYTYNYANRMTQLTDGTDTYIYAYNGLGDRYQQGINGMTTTYQLDLTVGLTQVLSDGTDNYLYGLGRIAEYDTQWSYFHTDALGSVRQLTDNTGEVTFAQSYEPYGTVMTTYGTGGSNYAYTGELSDPSGLTYLRARYMNPSLGNFTTRDTWGGDYNSPMSLNRFMYVEGNPVNFTDPSGKTPAECSSYFDMVDLCRYKELYDRAFVNNEDPTVPPPGISWKTQRLNAPLASSVESDAEESQYFPYDPEEKLRKDRGDWGFELCGQIVLSMLIELYNPSVKYTLKSIWSNGTNESSNSRNGHQLAIAIDRVFPEKQNWIARNYSYRNITEYRGGLQKELAGVTHDLWWMRGGQNILAEILNQKIDQQKYLILLVSITTADGVSGNIKSGGTGHWVLLTGLSAGWNYGSENSLDNWVKINNPFSNREEYYHWSVFKESMANAGGGSAAYFMMEVWPGIPDRGSVAPSGEISK